MTEVTGSGETTPNVLKNILHSLTLRNIRKKKLGTPESLGKALRPSAPNVCLHHQDGQEPHSTWVRSSAHQKQCCLATHFLEWLFPPSAHGETYWIRTLVLQDQYCQLKLAVTLQFLSHHLLPKLLHAKHWAKALPPSLNKDSSNSTRNTKGELGRGF